MPVYEYNCVDCNINIEIPKSISQSDTVELCEKCGGAMNKVFGTFGIQFKGSGFYRTDNRK
jgi:putative FmdB family regulatory protein